MTISQFVIQVPHRSKGQDIVQHMWSVKPVIELFPLMGPLVPV